MPKPHQRTRTQKRHQVKLPSGSGLATHFRKKKPKTARCIKCGRPLFGVATHRAAELSKLSLSEKRPQRMFGGQLCSTCLSESLKQAARSAP